MPTLVTACTHSQEKSFHIVIQEHRNLLLPIELQYSGQKYKREPLKLCQVKGAELNL